jgi:tetratricopeptide (TPR) repeat protein
MICPNCGSNMSDKRKRCERCGTDLTIYKKIYRASNLYYNNGLSKAKVRDLSGAIGSLRNSLELNKKNTNARNLLGLIYYEMGETVAALTEWVISRHFQPEDNDAEEYINKVQSNPTKLDALNQAIKRYNTALHYAKQGSGDLAIIQLKKVTTLNPHFIRAFHLLALLYMKDGDNEKAKKYLIRAGKIDVSNTTTLRYMRELETPLAAKDLENNPEAEQSSNTSAIMPISSYREDKPNIWAFINLVLGILVGVAVTTFLIVPTIKKNQTSGENTNYVDYSTGLAKQEEQEKTIQDLQKNNTELEQQKEQLQAQIDSLSSKEDTTAIYDPLFTATIQYYEELKKPERNRDYTAIADILATVDETKYETQAAINLLTRLRDETYPEVAIIHYNAGHSNYSKAKYQEALTEFGKALIFDPQDVDAIYFTARSYHRMEDYEKASEFYNIVIKDYPDSNRVKDSQTFLTQIESRS